MCTDFITALSLIALNEKRPECSPTVAWLNTLWGRHTVQYYIVSENGHVLRGRNKTPEFIWYYPMCTKFENRLK